MQLDSVSEASAVNLSGGAPTMTVASGGGPDNTAGVPVTAVRTGGSTIIYRLVAEGGND
jgi:hypothetical protein